MACGVSGIFAIAFLRIYASALIRHSSSNTSSNKFPNQLQHIYIIRHGDKYSEYPDCSGHGGTDENGQPCFDEELMGNNPPITNCGIKQANDLAGWLQQSSRKNFGIQGPGIQQIISSPFTRALQTALPLAVALDKQISVEDLASEGYQSDGPQHDFNNNEPPPTVEQLSKVQTLWNLGYGSPPIQTPEDERLYHARMLQAVKAIKERFPPTMGNLAIYSHAVSSFSLAYGLCNKGTSEDEKLQHFVNWQAPIAPAGVIHVVFEMNGQCWIKQTQNDVAETLKCGQTKAEKCRFNEYPSFYWYHSSGQGPGYCEMKTRGLTHLQE